MVALKKLVFQTYTEFARDGGSRLSAALAYYSLFALAPALLLSVALATAVADSASVDPLLRDSLARLLGSDLANAFIGISQSRSSTYQYGAAWVGVGVLLVASALSLTQLQAAFDRMWHVDIRAGVSIWRIVRVRAGQATIVLVPAALLVAGVLANSLSALVSARPFLAAVIGTVQVLGSPLAVLFSSGLAFLALFKYLPDVIVPWRAAALASAVSATAWVLGTYLFGLYVGRVALGSTYGAAGSVFVLLIWLNYSARVVLLACKAAKVMAEQRGSIRLRPYAMKMTYEMVEKTS
jgi:membrane protein